MILVDQWLSSGNASQNSHVLAMNGIRNPMVRRGAKVYVTNNKQMQLIFHQHKF